MIYVIVFLFIIYVLIVIKAFRSFLREYRHWHYSGSILAKELTITFLWPFVLLAAGIFYLLMMLWFLVEWYLDDQ